MKSILLPYADFTESAAVYSPTTKIEAVDSAEYIINILHQHYPNFVVNSHWDMPGIQAWKGHEMSLCNFALMMCEQLGDTSKMPFFEEQLHAATDGSMDPPGWMKIQEINISHRSELIRCNPYYYKKYWPECPVDIPLIWSGEYIKD
jgi:hypothetical protein